MVEIFSRANPYRGPVRAVVLDWAGTAVDFGSFGNIQPFIDGFRENWIDVTPEEVRKDMGLAVWDHLVAMLGADPLMTRWIDVYGVPPSDFDIRKIFVSVEGFAPAAAAYAEPVPGLLDAVFELRNEGIKIGSTSSLGFQAMEALSEAARARGYAPDAVVCSTDVPAGRPFPWMCWQNAVTLEVYPLESIVKVGDTVFDIQEGLNAGMWTVGVTKTSSELAMGPEEVERADQAELRDRMSRIEKRFLDAGAHFVIEGAWECPKIVERISRMLARGERP
ncbi:MAG: phosphonoacetaldehyde hydrolase [Syntrophobacteraceae bacterium]